MRYSAIFKINLVILEFVRKEDISKIKKEDKNKVKKSKFKEFLVKFMFNLKCGNLKKYKMEEYYAKRFMF